MKRSFVIVGSAGIALSLVACGGEGTKSATSSTTSAVTSESEAVTWGYLSTTYAELLGADCDPNASSFASCAMTLNAQLGPFEADVKELPVQKARANVLSGIKMIRDGYAEYSQANCSIKPTTNIDCNMKALDVSFGLNIVSTNVKREASGG